MRPGFGPAGGRASQRFVGGLRFLDNVDYARAPIKVYPQQQQHKLYYKMISVANPPISPRIPCQPTAYLSYRKYKHHQRIMKIILAGFFFFCLGFSCGSTQLIISFIYIIYIYTYVCAGILVQ